MLRTSASSAPTRKAAPPEEEQEGVNNDSIPARLRKAGKEVITERSPPHKVKTKGRDGHPESISAWQRR